MKTIGWALAAALALSTVPLVANAQYGSGSSSAAVKAPETAKPDRAARRRGKAQASSGAGDTARGMAESPAIIAAAGVRCTPASASLLGQSAGADGVKTNVYEVACSEGPGYVFMASEAGAFTAGYECFALRSGNEAQAATGQAQANALTCKLPANADPIVGFRKLAAPAVPGCTIDQARYIGSNGTTKEANYEVGCDNRPGVILKLAGPGSPAGTAASSIIACDRLGAESAVKCEYTTKAETIAPITALVARSGRQCQVTDGRFVGAAAGKPEEFYEAKCADGAGFMLVANTGGTFNRIIDCARATGVGGGCTLTDSVEALNQEAGVYKGLATKAGFDCDVGQYRLLGIEQTTKREAVELQCKNRPEGVIAFFPVTGSGKADFYDCTKTSYRKLNCGLTKAEAAYPRLTSELSAKGRQCQVNGVRGVGILASRSSEMVEVSCAGGPGYMLEYVSGGAAFAAPKTVIACADAKEIGDGCKLASATATTRR